MNKNYFLILLAFAALTSPVFAQDVRQSTLNWQSGKNINQTDNTMTEYVCSFTTVADQKINWLQQNGSNVTTYTVNSVDGSWTNVAAEGQVVYHVTSDQLSGDFTFVRSGGTISLHVKLNLNGTPNFDFVFLIDSVTP